MTQNSELILKLRDIHLPAPVGVFPLPPAWWVLIVLVLLLLSTLIYLLFYWRKKRLRQALRQLKKIELVYQRGDDDDVAECLSDLGSLLKHYAIEQFPQTQLAHCYGEAWLSFLQKTSWQGEFTAEQLDMIYWPYQKQLSPADMAQLIDRIRQWLLANPHRSYRRLKI